MAASSVALTSGHTGIYVHNTHFCNATPQTRGRWALSQLICFQQLTNMPRTANCPTLLQNPSPVASNINRELLIAGRTFFDYGCGHGEDVELLGPRGVMASGWDPAFRPDAPRTSAESGTALATRSPVQETHRRHFEQEEAEAAEVVLWAGRFPRKRHSCLSPAVGRRKVRR